MSVVNANNSHEPARMNHPLPPAARWLASVFDNTTDPAFAESAGNTLAAYSPTPCRPRPKPPRRPSLPARGAASSGSCRRARCARRWACACRSRHCSACAARPAAARSATTISCIARRSTNARAAVPAATRCNASSICALPSCCSGSRNPRRPRRLQRCGSKNPPAATPPAHFGLASPTHAATARCVSASAATSTCCSTSSAPATVPTCSDCRR